MSYNLISSFLCACARVESSWRSQQEVDESLEIEELLAVQDKVKDVEFSSDKSIER